MELKKKVVVPHRIPVAIKADPEKGIDAVRGYFAPNRGDSAAGVVYKSRHPEGFARLVAAADLPASTSCGKPMLGGAPTASGFYLTLVPHEAFRAVMQVITMSMLVAFTELAEEHHVHGDDGDGDDGDDSDGDEG